MLVSLRRKAGAETKVPRAGIPSRSLQHIWIGWCLLFQIQGLGRSQFPEDPFGSAHREKTQLHPNNLSHWAVRLCPATEPVSEWVLGLGVGDRVSCVAFLLMFPSFWLALNSSEEEEPTTAELCN